MTEILSFMALNVCMSNIMLQKQVGSLKEEEDALASELKRYLDDIEKTIEYFESAFSQDIDRDIETKFHNFFISLKDTQGIEVSEQQINRLHEIVTKCYEQTGRFATIYRRILIKLSSNKDQFNDSEKQ
jgi:hypothetical protein